MRNQVELCVERGVCGVVGPANASEFMTLSDDERRKWLQIVINAADGRVPVIASITSGHEIPSSELGKLAIGLGASGVMSMPPLIMQRDEAGCYNYYAHLTEVLDVPVIVQNYNAPLGTPMSPTMLARLCSELDGIDYIKEEVSPEPHCITATLNAVGSHCKGIFGGQGGIFLIDEFLRGAVGNMPASHNADLLVSIWDLLERGEEEEARSLFVRILPLMSYERLYGVAVYKEVLVKRGIVACAKRRVPGHDIDELDRRELNRIFSELESFLNP